VEEGGADFVVALEAVRACRYLRPGAVLLVNKRVIQPPGRWYDLEELIEAVKNSWPRSYVVPCYDSPMA
jgi:indolepyruvate ferredoxin oxidoreductase beta subunit